MFAQWRLPRIRDVFNKGYGDAFFVSEYARQVAREVTYLTRQRGLPLRIERLSDVEPAVGDWMRPGDTDRSGPRSGGDGGNKLLA